MPLKLGFEGKGIVFEGARRLVFVMLALTICKLAWFSEPLPNWLENMFMVIVGFYYGGKLADKANNQTPKETP